ncbi:transmembrane protein 126A [Mantella aurantiaca]
MGDYMRERSPSDTNEASAKQPALPIGEFLQQNFKRLPRFEQFFFQYGSSLVSINSFACGLMAHSLFRNTLKVRRGYLLSCLPVTAVPVVFTAIYHELLVTQPLIEGSLTCHVCAMVRSGYIGVCMGGVAPVLLAAFVNLMMVPNAMRSPVHGSVMREMISFTKPVFMRLRYFLLYEAIASVFLSTRQFATIEKLLQMPPVTKTTEEEELQ